MHKSNQPHDAALQEHVASDEKTHKELREKFDMLFKVIRKWALVGGILGGILGHAVHALEGCASGLPQPVAADLSAYQDEQIQCVVMYDTRETIDLCRAKSRAKWCVKYPTSPNCPWNDGGRE